MKFNFDHEPELTSVQLLEKDIQIQIDKERVSDELKKLATFSDAELPAVTRILYTPKDIEARAYLISLFEEAGLSVRVDAIGNIFARWEGENPELPAIATGSHFDALPLAGQYDGTVGILGALEAIRSLKKTGYVPKRSIEILAFTSEEPTRFKLGCVGSRMLEGSLDPKTACELTDDDGLDFDTIRKNAGFRGDLCSVKLKPGHYSYFLELHTEQGPILEEEGTDVGIVTSIAAPSTIHITLEGDGGHAGAVLMPERNDTACAGAEITLLIESLTSELGGEDTVATVGIFNNGPGAVNSIPRNTFLAVDIRDVYADRRDAILETLETRVAEICERRGVRGKCTLINKDYPAQCSDELIDKLEEQANEMGISSKRMISRAYHDCLFMAHIVPSAMLFVPCYKGYSHRPEEYASPDQIEKGVRVIAGTLRDLSKD